MHRQLKALQLLLVSLLIVFTSCNKASSVEQTKEFSTAFTLVDSINLEFSSESIIKSIDNILFWKDYIYLLQNNELLKFSLNGEYLEKLKAKGDGPGEYNQITWAEINKNNELVIYDELLNRVTFYDTTLRYIRHYSLGEEIKFYQMFVSDAKNQYYFYNTNLFDNKYTIDQYDSEFHYQDSFCLFPYNSVVQLRLRGNRNLAYLAEKNCLLVLHMFDPVLKVIQLNHNLEIDSVNITPEFWKNINDRKVKELFPDIGAHPQKLFKYIADKSKIWKIFGITESLVLIEYWLPKDEFILQIINLDTKKAEVTVNIPKYLGEVDAIHQDYIFFAKHNYDKEDQNPTIYKFKYTHHISKLNDTDDL